MVALGRILGIGLIALAGLSAPMRAIASFETVIPTNTAISNVSVKSFLDHGPARGYAPVEIDIQNRLNRPGTWNITFVSDQNDETNLTTSYQVEVGPSSSKRVALTVPVAPSTQHSSHSGYGSSMEIRVFGPGVQGRSRSILSPNWGNYTSQSLHVGLSESVALKLKEPLRQNSENQRRDLTIHSLELGMFPRDARGLTGLDVIVLTRDEWKSPSLPRKALERWLATGGELILTDATRADNLSQELGLGQIRSLKQSDNTAQATELYSLLGRTSTIQMRLGSTNDYLPGRWDFSDTVKPIIPSFPLFMLVVIAIAGLLGPLNLWWGFRKKNIMRVLWTTPALSGGLSVLVGLGIILSDGFGGTGIRSLWVMLLPDEQLEVKIQEQVSRTGVLLGTQFSMPQGVQMYPVRVSKRTNQTPQSLSEQSDGTRGGDWFANRRIQGQVLEQVRTTRARVELVPAPDGPPQVLTTVGIPFSQILVRDVDGNLWKAENAQPGKPLQLKKATSSDERTLFKNVFNRDQHPGKRLKAIDPGWFIALTDPQYGEWIDSLGSISWKDEPVVFTGKIVTTGRQP